MDQTEEKAKTAVAETTVEVNAVKTIDPQADKTVDAEAATAAHEPATAEEPEASTTEETENTPEATEAEADTITTEPEAAVIEAGEELTSEEEPAEAVSDAEESTEETEELIEAVSDVEKPAEETEAPIEAISDVEETTEEPQKVAAQAVEEEPEPAEEQPAEEPTAEVKEEATTAEPEKEPTVEKEPVKKEEAPEPATPLSELVPGAELTGRVVGIADFGAFVDIGAETDGLVHISELSEDRVKKVTDVVSVSQKVNVWIKDVDVGKERISLSMKSKPKYQLRNLKPGMVVEGTVTGIRNYGVFVDIGSETEGLVHVSEMAEGYVNKPSELVSRGDEIEVRIKKVDRRRRRINLSMKGLGPSVSPPPQQQEEESSMPTTMELAMRRALGELETETEEGPDVPVDVEEANRDELSEVFTRMLQEYREDEEEI